MGEVLRLPSTSVLRLRSGARVQRAEVWEEGRVAWLGARRSPHTRRAYGIAMRQFEEFLGAVALWEVGVREVRGWQGELVGAGLCAASVGARLSAVSSFYGWMAREGVCAANPFRMGNVVRPRVYAFGKARPLERETLRRLFEDLEGRALRTGSVSAWRNYGLLLGYFVTGARASELLAMRWEDVRRSRSGDGYVWMWRGKGGKAGRVGLPAVVYEAMARMAEAAGWEQAGFVWRPVVDYGTMNFGRGRLDPERAISAGNGRRVLRMALRRIGVREWRSYGLHDLRHSFALAHYERFKDVAALRALLHHGSLATTDIYVRELADPADGHGEAVLASILAQGFSRRDAEIG